MCRNRLAAALLGSLLLLQLGGRPVGAASPDEEAAARRRRLLVRSLLLPGLGQLGEKRYLAAALFAGAEIACLAGALRHNHLGNTYYWRYRQAGDEASAVLNRRLTERHDRSRNQFLAAAVAVWALNLVDALALARRRYGETGGVRPSLRISHETIALGIDFPVSR